LRIERIGAIWILLISSLHGCSLRDKIVAQISPPYRSLETANVSPIAPNTGDKVTVRYTGFPDGTYFALVSKRTPSGQPIDWSNLGKYSPFSQVGTFSVIQGLGELSVLLSDPLGSDQFGNPFHIDDTQALYITIDGHDMQLDRNFSKLLKPSRAAKQSGN
jgi:hypothetical protein